MMIVTGGAGFIGSQLIKGLNLRGEKNILVADDLTNGKKFSNLTHVEIADYMDKTEFLTAISEDKFKQKIKAVFHLGACSKTTVWDGKMMMQNNYSYSKTLLEYCQRYKIPFIYASSAAVYGNKQGFEEKLAHEAPLNVYGYSKWQFDQWLRQRWHKLVSQVVGLRYFNVYGPGENHKGSMASVAYHLHNQLLAEGACRLFEGCDGYGNGEQRRDFIYVGDTVKVKLWFLDNPQISGIYNCGTGKSQTFNDVAHAVMNHHEQQYQQKPKLTYIAFPDHLKNAYQSYTQANIKKLRAAGYQDTFMDVDSGVKAYLDSLTA